MFEVKRKKKDNKNRNFQKKHWFCVTTFFNLSDIECIYIRDSHTELSKLPESSGTVRFHRIFLPEIYLELSRFF